MNQWDPADRILREDFNADNLKIAAALAGKLDRVELLESQKMPTEMAGMVFLNLENRHWENWEFICYHISFSGKTAPEGLQFKVGLNGDTDTLPPIPWGDFFFLFWPGHDLDRQVLSLLIAPQCSLFRPKCTYRELKRLSIIKVTEELPTGRHNVYGLP